MPRLMNHARVVQISDVVYSPNGHTVASGSEDGTLRLWRPSLLSPRTAGAVHQYVLAGSGLLSSHASSNTLMQPRNNTPTLHAATRSCSCT